MKNIITVVLELETEDVINVESDDDLQALFNDSNFDADLGTSVTVLDFDYGHKMGHVDEPTLPKRFSGRINSNEDLVIDLMNFSPYGALCQGFVMEAIQRYARAVADAPPVDMGDLVSGEAWKRVATDIRDRCDTFYNRHETKKA